MNIIFNEGLWNLGKSYDSQNSGGFTYLDYSGTLLGELRYIRPIIFLELCSALKDNYQKAIFDRTPYFMRILAENNLARNDVPFLGIKNAFTDIKSIITQMKWLEKSFEDIITRLSSDNQLIFNIYIPSNWDVYYNEYILNQSENWYELKFIKYNCLNISILKKITQDLLQTFLDLRLLCHKNNKPEVNLKVSKVW